MKKMSATLAGVTLATSLVAGAAQPAAAATQAKPSVSPKAVSFSATSCAYEGWTQKACLYVNGTGLHVNYAVETNVNTGAGRAFISSTWDGATHHSSAKIYPGQSWRYDYNVNMHDGNKVCGSIEGLYVSCVTITP